MRLSRACRVLVVISLYLLEAENMGNNITQVKIIYCLIIIIFFHFNERIIFHFYEKIHFAAKNDRNDFCFRLIMKEQLIVLRIHIFFYYLKAV